QVALRERAAVGQGFGQGQRSGQGDDSAHSGPTDDEDAFDGGHRFVLMEDFSPDQIGDKCAREQPSDAKKYHEGAEESAVEDERFQRIVVNAGENERQLEADEDENESVDRKCEGIPEA